MKKEWVVSLLFALDVLLIWQLALPPAESSGPVVPACNFSGRGQCPAGRVEVAKPFAIHRVCIACTASLLVVAPVVLLLWFGPQHARGAPVPRPALPRQRSALGVCRSVACAA